MGKVQHISLGNTKYKEMLDVKFQVNIKCKWKIILTSALLSVVMSYTGIHSFVLLVHACDTFCSEKVYFLANMSKGRASIYIDSDIFTILPIIKDNQIDKV